MKTMRPIPEIHEKRRAAGELLRRFSSWKGNNEEGKKKEDVRLRCVEGESEGAVQAFRLYGLYYSVELCQQYERNRSAIVNSYTAVQSRFMIVYFVRLCYTLIRNLKEEDAHAP